MHEILHILLHTFIDALKTLPFLFVAYLLIEYIEHRASDKMISSLSKLGKFSPIAGAAAGLVPQCGFAITTTRLYTGGIITLGTLVAVFISTSDEAIPVLLSSPEHYRYVLYLIAIKFVVGTAFGFITDLFVKKRRLKSDEPSHEHDHIHEHCHDDCCDHGIWRPAFKHTFRSFLFIFGSLLVFETILHIIGEDAIASLFLSGSAAQPILAALIGFIPGCAPSIILSEMFVSSAVSFPALVAGLITNTGIGLVFLFRSNKNIKQNILFTLFLFVLASSTGMLMQWLI